MENANHREICELKMAASAMTSKTHKECVGSEVELLKKMDRLQADRGEREFHTEIYIRKLKQVRMH